jgi:predicted transposase YdaD
LLEQVAAQIDRIEEPRQRGNLAACVEVLAGLRFDIDLIRQLFREEVMRESVVYQDILQKGLQQGTATRTATRAATRRGDVDFASAESSVW